MTPTPEQIQTRAIECAGRHCKVPFDMLTDYSQQAAWNQAEEELLAEYRAALNERAVPLVEVVDE